MAVVRVQLPAPGGGAAVFVATCVQERAAEAPRLAHGSQEPREGGSQGDKVGTLHASSNQDSNGVWPLTTRTPTVRPSTTRTASARGRRRRGS
jgi:hypothetical protein